MGMICCGPGSQGDIVPSMEASDKQQQRARFWKKFLRLTRGRVTVLKALDIAVQEERDTEFKEIIRSVKAGVDGGRELSQVLQEYPSYFSPSVVELVRTAENTGAWDEILSELAEGLSEGTFE